MRWIAPIIVVIVLLLPVALGVASMTGRFPSPNEPAIDDLAAPEASEIVTTTARVPGTMTVRVVPDRVVWAPRETFAGVLVFENTGDRPIELTHDAFAAPIVLDARPFPYRSDMMVCRMGARGPRAVSIAAGASHEIAFEVETDRLRSGPGVIVGAGERCTISHRGVPSHPHVTTRVVPATVEVRADRPGAGSPRLVAFDAAGARICAVREDGSVTIHDVADGRLLWIAADRDPTDPRWAPGRRYRLTPDARHLASLRADPERSAVYLALYDLAAHAAVPRRAEHRVSWGTGLSVADDVVLLTDGHPRVTRVDPVTGAMTTSRWDLAELSSCGRFAGRAGRDHRVIARTYPGGAPVLDIDVTAHNGRASAVFGSTGVFIDTPGREAPTRYHPYDGGRASEIPAAHGRVMIQGRDGRFVVLGRSLWEDRADVLTVWDMHRAAVVCTTAPDTGWRTPRFAADGTLLVVAVHRGDSGRAYDDTLDVYDLVGGAPPCTITLHARGPSESAFAAAAAARR